ncbi:Glycosyl transferase group 2 [Mactra antiquata]
MNTFPAAPTLQEAKAKIPFMCFRVVTRGLYPELVRRNVERNIEICYKVGLDNFKFEVVTDNALQLPKSALVRELVVPNGYVTKRNSLFKARALQYCNEPSVNILSREDWVIHLDEETLLTKASAIGLANFASQNSGDIGQGVISYANEEIVNWWTTLADSVRVSVDLGMMRFSFRKLGYPLMGFKGSYIIAKESVEKDIGFDFGPKGSVAEDVMFALVAWSKGYKFNFVEGEMWEKSPFTLGDYIKQRKRWFVGHMYTLLSPEIPLKCKIGMIPTDLGWFLLVGNILNFPASFACPIPLPLVLNIIAGSMGGLILFLFVFGSIKSFSLRKYGLIRKIILVFATIPIIPLAACLDAAASVYGFYTRNSGGFHIVKKETSQLRNPPTSNSTNNNIV